MTPRRVATVQGQPKNRSQAMDFQTPETFDLTDVHAPVEITIFTKQGGPLSKRISLNEEGKINSDGSTCVMSRGTANRRTIRAVEELAMVIGYMPSHQALALGRMREGLGNTVYLVPKKNADADHVARTVENFVYAPGEPAYVLIDFDRKGMPAETATKIKANGGLWPTLVSVVPELENVARVVRYSTSAGLYRADTGDKFPGSDGQHIYVLVRNGADAVRFLTDLHERCWLAGYGWFMVGVAGQLLDRSIVDRMVGAPERLVFEGAPTLVPPLAQDQEARRPIAHPGEALDTLAVAPPLFVDEKSHLRQTKARAAETLQPDAAHAHNRFVDKQVRRIVERSGVAEHEARKTVIKQCNGVLLPDVELSFDSEDFAGCTVADVLAEPERFVGLTMADPVEGISYGRCKAKILRRSDGSMYINSFAHGRTVYELRKDARAVRADLEKESDNGLFEKFIGTLPTADMDDIEVERLKDYIARRGNGISKAALNKQVKAAIEEAERKRHAHEEEFRTARRQDPRPRIDLPAANAPWAETLTNLDRLATPDVSYPPVRDTDRDIAVIRRDAKPFAHAFTNANEPDGIEAETSATEQPESWLIRKLNDVEVALMFERYADFVTGKKARSVQLSPHLVRGYMSFKDSKMPTIIGVSTMPLVLADGTLLAPDAFDRDRGIEFHIPADIRAAIPKPDTCDDEAVQRAMAFLMDEWLCDVLADYPNKCVLIAVAMTLIERSLLEERPCFFVAAGKRGSGKTTALQILTRAATGELATATAWSSDENERRKALLAQLMCGSAYTLWDNIPLGLQISCPHIERACTSSFYSDRKLGETKTLTASAATVHLFTGNNVAPKGDLASRSLTARLDTDRADPENREFRHQDIRGWTAQNRGRIVAALLTILLGNPALEMPRNAEMKTRFKLWQRLVGFAVEHAAALHNPNARVDFAELFAAQDAADEESATLADVLLVLKRSMPPEFKANDVAELAQGMGPDNATVREFLFPNAAPGVALSPKTISKRLGNYVGNPVRYADRTLILRAGKNPHTKIITFYVAG
jgi:hypothetical protein